MLTFLLPYKLHIHILQLEGYQPIRFINWVILHFFTREVEQKKPLVWTKKAKLIVFIALVYATSLVLLMARFFGIVGILLSAILFTQSYLFILLGLLTLKPYEIVNKSRVKNRTSKKIKFLKSKGLQVIGITGSYGKTSTKEILYKILSKKYKVLRTPESYNTLFGVSKVIEYELNDMYDFFICEMGAYKIGEIKELCNMVLPDHAILTGINEQHIERFGSIEKTIKAKFELVDFVVKQQKAGSIILLNKDSTNIVENYSEHIDSPTFYSSKDRKCAVYENGMEFSTLVCGQEINFHTRVLGYPYISNITAAANLACLLDVPINCIKELILVLEPVPHRLELRKLKKYVLIDDAYNSNVDGFKEAISLLSKFKPKKTIFITPGIIELGNKTNIVHRQLGKILNEEIDHIILVGTNVRTNSLASEINPKKLTFINSISSMDEAINETGYDNPVVLIENDLPENY